MSNEQQQDPAPATVVEAVTDAERHELRAAALNVERWKVMVELCRTRIENARLMMAAAEGQLQRATLALHDAERDLGVIRATTPAPALKVAG